MAEMKGLRSAILKDAIYGSKTLLPKGFHPTAAGMKKDDKC